MKIKEKRSGNQSFVRWNKFAVARKSTDFKNYLRELCSMDLFLLHDIEAIAEKQDIYVFSGIIRDFFLQEKIQGRKKGSNSAKDRKRPRDLDFVIVGDFSEQIFSTGHVYQNQYGGLKLTLGNIKVDIWSLHNTWGIVQENKPLSPESLLETSFFNFSAIVYDYKNEIFVVGKPFIEFLNTHILDIVYKKNPKPELCIVNSMYYREKLGCAISKRLSKWLIKEFYANPQFDYDAIQQNHFGKIIYNKKKITNFINQLDKQKDYV